MFIVAIDPGKTTGVAWYDLDNKTFNAKQSQDPREITSFITDIMVKKNLFPHKVLIENYLSAGHMTNDAKLTVKLIGYFENYLHFHKHCAVDLVPPQRRLSGVAEAKELSKTKDIPGPHSWDALAHCLTTARELYVSGAGPAD